MLIDCDRCEARNVGCGDCVVSVMLGNTEESFEIGAGIRRALDILADSGMIPPLRLAISDERAS